MGELHFQIDSDRATILAIIRQVATIAENRNCIIQEGDLSENGKKFNVVGADKNLKQVQAALKAAGLPKGIFWTKAQLAQIRT